jgi:DNA polymerase-3 subunit delta'
VAEAAPDPRDIDRHPRRRFSLHGHAAAEQRLLKAWQSGKLHHAWLLCGPQGIGKATLAYRFARFLLAGAGDRGGLDVSPASPAARYIAAGAHPDMFVLECAWDGKNKKLKGEIAVADARRVSEFLSRTAALGGFRVAIVDTADDLNVESANALLKGIEEPPSRAVFLLVSHRPGGLLRTIRSRCIALALEPLTVADTMAVLSEIGAAAGSEEAELRRAAELSGGSPGRALALLGSKGAAAFAGFLAEPRLTPSRCVEIGSRFAGRDSGEDFAVFCDLFTSWIAERARERGLAGGGAALAKAHADIDYSIRQADALNLDRRQTVVDALLTLGEALKTS